MDVRAARYFWVFLWCYRNLIAWIALFGMDYSLRSDYDRPDSVGECILGEVPMDGISWFQLKILNCLHSLVRCLHATTNLIEAAVWHVQNWCYVVHSSSHSFHFISFYVYVWPPFYPEDGDLSSSLLRSLSVHSFLLHIYIKTAGMQWENNHHNIILFELLNRSESEY